MKVKHAKAAVRPASPMGIAAPFVLGAGFFWCTCLCAPSAAKSTATLLLLCALGAAFLRFSKLRERMSPVVLALGALVAMAVVSTLYAVAGKFALNESLKLVSALCLAVLVLAFAPQNGRAAATVLAAAAAVAGLVSIDLISTRVVSGVLLGVLAPFTTEFAALDGVEAGVRMISLFENGNIFAGVAGIGVLLSISLALDAPSKGERRADLSLLFLNALAFLLAFSMGASGAIALAFVAYLLLERPSRRPAALVLMAQTLLLTVLAAAVISKTSFTAWVAARPIPLVCAILGAVALCASDHFLGTPLSAKLQGRAVAIVAVAAVVAVGLFAVVAYHLTGPVELAAGESLRRAIYPEAGTYTVVAEGGDGAVVCVESQNQQETMMHTSTVLYTGALDGAVFSVPEDSMVVYLTVSAQDGARLAGVVATGARSYRVPLGYRLLPSFIANRLQGLWANENAIQRFVFFSDGLKIFRRSPVVGLGVGAFENAVRSVQSFDYQTKYAHNHYIQLLVETGVIGLALFLLLLGLSAVGLLRERLGMGEECHPLTPALGAALVFMAVHAATEVVFSTYPYLPIAFGVFALIGMVTQGVLSPRQLQKKGQTVGLIALCVLLAFYGVQLLRNTWARSINSTQPTMDTLVQGASVDPFEWADYMLSYVDNAVSGETVAPEILEQANRYAARLERVDSNTIPIHLAEFYFRTGRPEQGLAMAEKYLDYVASNPDAWSLTFRVLERYDDGSASYADGVVRIAGMLDEWNRVNLGDITLDEQAQAFLARLTAPADAAS